MPITSEFVEAADAALASSCPLVSQNEDAIAEVKRKILSYDQKLGQAPSVEMVCGWGRERERELQAAVDAQNSEHETEQGRKNDRKQRLRDWRSPSAYDKPALVQEFRERNRIQEQPAIKPNTNYTKEQIEKMSAEDYKRLVLNLEQEELNVSRPLPERQKLLERIALRSPKVDTRVKKALRRIVREGLSK